MKRLLTILLYSPLVILLSWVTPGVRPDRHFAPISKEMRQVIRESTMMFTTTMVTWSLGEYVNLGIGSDGKAYTVTNDPDLMGDGDTGTPGLANIIGTTQQIAKVVNSLHNWMVIGTNGKTYFGGQPSTGIPYITGNATYDGTQDSAGSSAHFFDMGVSGWNNPDGEAGWYLARDTIGGGTLWFCGDGQNGARGDGTASANNKKWVQITLPANWHVQQMVSGFVNIILLDTLNASGVVIGQKLMSWAINQAFASDLGYASPAFGAGASSVSTYNVPHEILINGQHAHNIRMIAGGIDCNYAVFDSLGIQKIFGWGIDGWRIAHSTSVSADPLNTPTDITSHLSSALAQGPLDTIVVTEPNTFILVGASSIRHLWGWGSTEQGTLGTGLEVNLATIGTPYNEPSANENLGGLVQFTPVEITPGKTDWQEIYNGQFFSYTEQGQDQKGRDYGWGRNKAGYFPVGTIPASSLIQGTYPDGWGRPIVTLLRNPFSMTVTNSQAQGCFNTTAGGPNTGSPCSLFSVTHYTTAAGITATTDGTHIFLSGSTSTSTGDIVYYTFSQVSGPATNLGVRSYSTNPNDTISANGLGTYVYKIVVVDPAWGSDSTTATVTVSAVTQTCWHFATSGSGTACDSAHPCAVTYFPTAKTSMLPGDTAAFNKGDVFPADLVVDVSGTSGNPIVITSYGTPGPDPVLGGMGALSGWTNISGNLWQAAWSGPTPRLMAINNALAGKSTTPNRTTGYSTFVPGSSTATKLHYASNPFSVNDSIVISTSAFFFDFSVCTGSTSTDATISPALSSAINGGNGAFRIGDTPDSATEWNLPSAGIIQAYSVGAPSGYSVPNVGIPLTISGNYIKVTGIRVKGADTAGIVVSGSHDVIDHDTVDFVMDGIQTSGATFDTVTFNVIAHGGNNGVQKIGFANYNNFIENNKIFDCGMIAGMGTFGSATQNLCGIIAGDSSNTVKFNTLDDIGYIPIAIYGNSFKADSNFIHRFCWIRIDGGGIYTWVGSLTTFNWREVVGNVIRLGGMGPMSYAGTTLTPSAAVSAVYLDKYTSQVKVSFNTADSISGPAFFDHGANDTITHNTSYASTFADLYLSEGVGPVISNVVVSNNVFGSAASGIPAVRVSTVNNDLRTMGPIDANNIVGAVGTILPFWTFSTGAGDAGTFRTPSVWTTTTTNDAHSNFQTGGIQFLCNPSASPASLPLTFKSQDLGGAVHASGPFTVAAYSSNVFLIWHLGYNVKPRTGKIFYK